MTPDRARIASGLRDARKDRGFTQLEAARHLGVSRSLIAQLELGNRDASPEELDKLADLYELSVLDLVRAEIASTDDDVLLNTFDRAPELLDAASKPQVEAALGLFQRARELRLALSRQSPVTPLYALARPRGSADAIAQGEQLARQERHRLGLGSVPLGELPFLSSLTGVYTCLVHLTPDVAGLCVREDDVFGIGLVINASQTGARHRYAWAQQYAHALVSPAPMVVVTRRTNAGELAQVRAAAFASAFLLPASGVRAWLARADKGQPSRRLLVAYGVADDDAQRAEVRSAPGSQTLGFPDAAAMARTFGAPYKAVVHRLLALGFLSEAESSALLRPKAVVAADRLLALHAEPPVESAIADVRVEIVDLAIEAYRRGAIDKAALSRIARQVELPGLPAERLIELAEAAR